VARIMTEDDSEMPKDHNLAEFQECVRDAQIHVTKDS